MRRLAAIALLVAACDARKLPPRPQTLVYIDTDLPAPAIAGHIDVDFFRPNGDALDSRSVSVPDASLWPLSFGTWSSGEEGRILVRIRIHPEGREPLV